MKKTMKLFAPITKVDDEQRLVFGVLAEEAVDKDGEIMDYEKSKPFFQKWNAAFSEKTDGQSVGNLREMHDVSAAGKFMEMNYDDMAKRIEVCAKVVDDDAWEKVVEGVYTGFSIGARRVGKSIVDPITKALRWVANPFEGSLVDNPCMYGANFTAVKADKTSEARAFAGKNTNAEKGLYTVSWFANLLDSLTMLQQSVESEAEYEGDGSPLPEQIRQEAKVLGQLLIAYTQEEVEEATGDASEGAEMKTEKGKPAEAGERPVATKVDEPGLRPTAEVKTEPVAEKGEKKGTESETPTKTDPAPVAAKVEGEVVTKAEHDALKAEVAKKDEAIAALKSDIAAVNEKLQTILKTPMKSPVRHPYAIVAEKKDDGVQKGEEKKDEPKDSLSAIKGIHAGTLK